LAKSVELFLVIGIIYLMRWEKRKIRDILINAKPG